MAEGTLYHPESDLKSHDPSKDWTLDQLRVEHQRLGSPVSYSESPKSLHIRFSLPGRLKHIVGIALVVIGLVATCIWLPIRRPADLNIVSISAMVLFGLALLYLLLGLMRCYKIVLTGKGLRYGHAPAMPGSSQKLTLQQIKRFKVRKLSAGYELAVHTRRKEKLTMIPGIERHRDAFLMAMLLIEHVKRQRAAQGVADDGVE